MKNKINLKLVLFFSEECEPCKHQKPITIKISKKYNIPLELIEIKDNETFIKARNFGIKSWPNILFIKNDTVVEQHIGYDLGVSEEANENTFENILKFWLESYNEKIIS